MGEPGPQEEAGSCPPLASCLKLGEVGEPGIEPHNAKQLAGVIPSIC